MAHKGQLFGKGNVRLFNSLQSDEHWGADIDERCRSYRQKLFCWQEKVRNSWRMSTSISCMLTHSLCSSFVSPDHSNCLKRECKGRCVFHLFIPSLWESRRKNDLRRICRWAAAISWECDRREMQPMPEKSCLIENKRARGRFLHKYFATITPLHILVHCTTATSLGCCVLL